MGQESLTHIILLIYAAKSRFFGQVSLVVRFQVANLDACQSHGKHKPEHTHDPGVIPKVIRQTAHQRAAHGSAGGAGDGAGSGVAAAADCMGRALDVP